LDSTVTAVLNLLEIFLVPLIIFLMQRGMGRKLDDFDNKREQAREEQKKNRELDTEWHDSMTAGMRAMLRAELISEYRKAKQNKYASTTTKEYVEKIETAYAKLGGNGLGKAMYEEIMSLPSEPLTITNDN